MTGAEGQNRNWCIFLCIYINFPQTCTALPLHGNIKDSCFYKTSKIQLCLAATCKARKLSFPHVKHMKGYSLPTQPQNPKLLFLCTLAALLSPLKGRILGVSCNLYENVMLSSSFIYVMQSQYSPLQNLKHTQ